MNYETYKSEMEKFQNQLNEIDECYLIKNASKNQLQLWMSVRQPIENKMKEFSKKFKPRSSENSLADFMENPNA